jgi:hypothetical protein
MKNIKQIKNKLYQYFKSLIKKILIKQYNKIKNYFLDNYKLNKKKKNQHIQQMFNFIYSIIVYLHVLLVDTYFIRQNLGTK